jgi:hypothetical protein
MGRLNEVYSSITSLFNDINKTDQVTRIVDDYLAGKHIK